MSKNLFYEQLQNQSDALEKPAKDIVNHVYGIKNTVIETEEEFIFSTLNEYIQSITNIEISKKELMNAICLVRLQRESNEKYGVQLSNDFSSATAQKYALDKSYNRGFEDGRKYAMNRINDILKEEN